MISILNCFTQEEKNNPVIILVVPADMGEAMHGKKTEQQRGHGAFVNSLSQLCVKHSSKSSLNEDSKWKVGLLQNCQVLELMGFQLQFIHSMYLIHSIPLNIINKLFGHFGTIF